MFFKFKVRADRNQRAQRSVIRKVAALPPDQQAFSAVYALGLRDGLQIAADIRKKTQKAKGDA